jgi:hypothetical protein
MEEIAQIVSGEKEGWMLITVMESGESSKPKDPS